MSSICSSVDWSPADASASQSAGSPPLREGEGGSEGRRERVE